MQILPSVLAAGVALFQLAAPTTRVTRSESVVVRAVFDGDTLDVATYGREGLARVSGRVPLSRLDELKRAESEAQSFRRGMWGASPQLPPPTSYTSDARAAKHPRAMRKKSKHRKSMQERNW